jgi:hypothetical protein
VSLAFRNEIIIKNLRKRGAYIKSGNMSGVQSVEKELDRILNKEKRLNEINTPCWVFITFITEEGKERGMAYHDEVKKPKGDLVHLKEEFELFMGEEFEIDEANEPTDI